MLALILFAPFLGFLSGSVFGFRLGFGACLITTSSILCAFFSSLILFYKVLVSNVIFKINIGSWITLNLLQVDWFFCIDSLTVIMLLVVTFISTLVHVYSTEYMAHDPHLPRFMGYLSFFTFFMLILITANNFLQLFLGWEGVGLCSYLLINFWFTRIQANKAAIKAMLINRIGDFFLLFAIFCIYNIFGTLNYDITFSLAPFFKKIYFNFLGTYFLILNFICLLLFIGAMGKSAQIGLHVWLPDAMEGPTPVSALIHAATMVTAGIFLIIRCSFFFEFAPLILEFIAYIGSLTTFFAASTGLFQNDVKKTIAYSTCSQLGYMIFACGLSIYDVALFHLSNHAFFKALLFLAAGSIIHSTFNEQDIRKLGGLKTLLPFSYSILLVGSLALIGFPFLAGFYSKDLILEIAFSKQNFFSYFCYFFGSGAVFCTSFYSTRLLFMIFLSEPNGNKLILLKAHESSFLIGVPLFLLALLSITVGFLSKDFFNNVFITLITISESFCLPFIVIKFPLKLIWVFDIFSSKEKFSSCVPLILASEWLFLICILTTSFFESKTCNKSFDTANLFI